MTQRKIQYWVIPPEANGEFVACMENVLDTYAEPYDKRFPVLCMDEQPVQLLKETRVPIAATRQHARRVDYEYERAGTASIFMFTEPLQGWRMVHAREQRTKVDWALEMEKLLRTRYAVNGGSGKIDSGLRQPEHAHDGSFLRSLSCKPSEEACPSY